MSKQTINTEYVSHDRKNDGFEQLQLFRKIDQAILNSAGQLQETFSAILNGIIDLIGSKNANIALINGKYLIIEASTEPSKIGVRLPINDSVSGMVVKNRKPINIGDIKQEESFKPIFSERMQSELTVPLFIQERVVGVLNTESPLPNAFSTKNQNLLVTLAGQAALAIQNAYSFEQLKTLRKIDKAILNSVADLNKTLDTILQSACELLRAEFGSLLLVEDNDLVIRASRGTSDSRINMRVSIDNSVTGLAFKQQEPVYRPDVLEEPLYQVTLKRTKMRTELAVPLVLNQRAIGVLNIESPEIDAFGEKEVASLEALANQAALAIWNARSYETINILHNIDKSILLSSTSFSNTLKVILDGAVSLTGAKYGGIMLVDGDYLVNTASTDPENLNQDRVNIKDSVSGLAYLTQKPVVLSNVRKEPLYKSALKSKEMHSELVVPMIDNGRVLGVINMESVRIGAFDDHHVDLLDKLAGQAALAIKNVRSRNQLEILREIDQAILASSTDLKATLDIVLQSSLKLLNSKYGNLLLVDGNDLVVEVTTTKPASNEIGLRLPIGNSISGIPILKKKTTIINDVSKHPKYHRVLQDEYMHSEIVTPLSDNDRIFGVLNIESTTRNAFTIEDQEILELLANQAAIAIKNAQSSEKLKALRKIDLAILNQNSSLQETLSIVLESGLNLIDAQYGNILLLKGNELEICATSASQVEVIGTKVNIQNSVTGKAVLTKQPIIIGDTEQEALYRRVFTFRLMLSELAVPLLENNNVLGVINIESPRRNAFTESDKQMLEALASQAAIAIKNANFQEELQQMKTIKAVGDAASWLVHKIGNLALNIAWPAERLMEEIVDSDLNNASVREDIEMIQRAAQQIGNLKQTLLEPLKEIETELLIVEEIIREVANDSLLPNEAFIFEFDPQLPYVRASREEITSVFTEVIDNATSAMQVTEEVQLKIMAYLAQDKKYIEIKFCDNGCGISNDEIDEIWAVGYTTKQEQAGTGLGLYTVAQIILRHDGHITAANNVDKKGSTFTIKLPVYKGNKGG